MKSRNSRKRASCPFRRQAKRFPTTDPAVLDVGCWASTLAPRPMPIDLMAPQAGVNIR